MVIDLEYPYTEQFKSGAINQVSDGRRYMTLTRFDGSQYTTSYARYLMSVHLGYFISSEYEVDHIDDDKANDCISNYQLLTPEENLRKYHEYCRRNGIWEYITLICSNCNKEYTLSIGNHNRRVETNQSGNYFCSSECFNVYRTIDLNLQQEIIKLADRYTSSHQLSEYLGVSRQTIDKYRTVKYLETLESKVIESIKEMDKSDTTCAEIAINLGISAKAVKKYRSNLPTKGPGIKVSDYIIETIKKMDYPCVTDTWIANALSIDNVTVAKYRTNRPVKINTEDIINMIQNADDGTLSNRALARSLNITKDMVNKYRNTPKLGIVHGEVSPGKVANVPSGAAEDSDLFESDELGFE